MKRTMFAVYALLTAMMMASAAPSPSRAAERFEDENVYVTSKLPPVYLGWKVAVGSTTQNVAWYYKVSAVVTGVGETLAAPAITAYSTYSPLSSTNSIRVMWSPVTNATSYNLYKSADGSSYYLLTNTNLTTYVDSGASLGAAYSAPSPRGGNLTVENDVSVGDDLAVAGDLTVTGTFSGKLESLTLAAMNADVPAAAGIPIYVPDATSARVCVSSGTTAGAYLVVTSTFTHCQ